MARLTTMHLDEAMEALEEIVVELDHVEVTDELVFVTGDSDLAAAAQAVGIAVANTNA